MSISVRIDVHGQELDFDRDTVHALGDSYGRRFRDAADELDRIAADIRRMYPASKDES